MKKYIRFQKVFILLGISYFIFLAGIYFLQEKIIFMPSDEVFIEIDKEKLNAEEFNLEVNEKVSIHGYFFDKENAKKTIVFFHGNNGNITNNISRMAIAIKMGFNGVIFDYRSYGQSTGKISLEKDLYYDSEAVYEYLTETKKIPRKNIVFWGQSLGGGVATEMANRYEIDKLIIESTFTNIANLTPKILRYSVPSFLKKYKFDNLAKIKNIKSPVLIMHSPEDEMINYQNGLDLFEQAGKSREFLEITGDHNNGFLESFEDYEEKIKKFLNK